MPTLPLRSGMLNCSQTSRSKVSSTTRKAFPRQLNGVKRFGGMGCRTVAKDSSVSSTGDLKNMKFHLKRHCNYGEIFAVVGSTKELGSWNKAKAVPMKWTEGDNWVVDVPFTSSSECHYKFIHTSDKGAVLGWESELIKTGDEPLKVQDDQTILTEQIQGKKIVEAPEIPDLQDSAVPFESLGSSSKGKTQEGESGPPVASTEWAGSPSSTQE